MHFFFAEKMTVKKTPLVLSIWFLVGVIFSGCGFMFGGAPPNARTYPYNQVSPVRANHQAGKQVDPAQDLYDEIFGILKRPHALTRMPGECWNHQFTDKYLNSMEFEGFEGKPCQKLKLEWGSQFIREYTCSSSNNRIIMRIYANFQEAKVDRAYMQALNSRGLAPKLVIPREEFLICSDHISAYQLDGGRRRVSEISFESNGLETMRIKAAIKSLKELHSFKILHRSISPPSIILVPQKDKTYKVEFVNFHSAVRLDEDQILILNSGDPYSLYKTKFETSHGISTKVDDMMRLVRSFADIYCQQELEDNYIFDSSLLELDSIPEEKRPVAGLLFNLFTENYRWLYDGNTEPKYDLDSDGDNIQRNNSKDLSPVE